MSGPVQILHTILITIQSCLSERSPIWVKCALYSLWKMKTNNFIMGTIGLLASFSSILGNWLIEETKIQISLIFPWLPLALAKFPDYSLMLLSISHFLDISLISLNFLILQTPWQISRIIADRCNDRQLSQKRSFTFTTPHRWSQFLRTAAAFI